MTILPNDIALLSDCQHEFPLAARPFRAIARRTGSTEQAVLESFRTQRAAGALSRIGAVWARGAGGAGALCAMRVPREDLERVAAIVNAEGGVNHNYEREHAWNLWYVITGTSSSQVREAALRIEDAAGLDCLFLPMVRAYRVDLGFDLLDAASHSRDAGADGTPVDEADRPLAALAERGLSLVERPFDLWAAELGTGTESVLATLDRWKTQGTLRRFGVVVRHHDLGYSANAMTVVQAPPSRADAIGAALAAQPGVTLAYQRITDARWPYNLYFMVHARVRGEAEERVAQALEAAGATPLPHETLFSLRRFKQTGGRYFSQQRDDCEMAS
jgi:DNA-binding Lrp family transcriptional regulator